MNLYKSKLYIFDLDYMIERLDILKELRNSSFLILGARGMICSAIADLLFRYNEKYDAGISLYLVGRNKDSIKERFSKYCDSKYFNVIELNNGTQGNLIHKIPHSISYIIDGNGPSSPGDINSYPCDSLHRNVEILKDLLQYAHDNKVKSTLYISSSEVYGIRDEGGSFKEDYYGYVDILNPRSSYACGKRSCENLCACYSDMQKVHTVIARPGHIYGPSARVDDDHIVSELSFEAANGHDLKMHSEGLQLRSYCYMLDCASAMLTILLFGKSGNAYNISNPSSVLSIRNMIELLAEAGEVKTIVCCGDDGHIGSEDDIIMKTSKRDNPMKNSSLNSEKLMALGWKGYFDARKGASHTVRIIREALMM